MKKQNNAIASKIDEKKEEITSINLSKFKEKLENVQLKEKRNRETIYVYPDDFSKSDINSEKGKKFRNSLRSKMKKFANNIFYFSKINEIEKLKAEIGLFEDYYKRFFRINDFSLNSLSQSKDAGKERDFQLMLDIIKEVKK